MTENTCSYCHDPDKVDEWCGAEKPGVGLQLMCTRKSEHKGDHVACGYLAHEADRWPNKGV